MSASLRSHIRKYSHHADLSSRACEEVAIVACDCVARLAGILKPEYADALRRIEVGGMSVKDYGDSVGISASNAGVRIFRARKALRKQVARSCATCAEHGCLDCTCEGTTAKKA
jgi:RNA polymerase sigma-70 factor (ECF subfamily)